MYQMLEGLTVIEASSFVASPSAGLYLAQMGAEVIRIDQIGGGPDFGRWPRADNGTSLYWENLNRAKKSVAIDMTRPEGRALVQALAASTGQFLTNFPVDGFLSHAQLAQTRADLITIRIMGQADGGPALDYTVNAAVGIPQLTGPASLGAGAPSAAATPGEAPAGVGAGVDVDLDVGGAAMRVQAQSCPASSGKRVCGQSGRQAAQVAFLAKQTSPARSQHDGCAAHDARPATTRPHAASASSSYHSS